MSDPAADQTIDITAEVCPMTFVRTKLRLERMRPGEILSVRLRGEEPLRNVPRAAREEGHSILRSNERRCPYRNHPARLTQ